MSAWLGYSGCCWAGILWIWLTSTINWLETRSFLITWVGLFQSIVGFKSRTQISLRKKKFYRGTVASAPVWQFLLCPSWCPDGLPYIFWTCLASPNNCVCQFHTINQSLSISPSLYLSILLCVCVCVYIYLYIYICIYIWHFKLLFHIFKFIVKMFFCHFSLHWVVLYVLLIWKSLGKNNTFFTRHKQHSSLLRGFIS